MPPSPRAPWARTWSLALAMLLAIIGITVIGEFDERASAQRARADMLREEGILAEVLAAEFRAGIAALDAGSTAPIAAVEVEGPRWRLLPANPADAVVEIEPQQLIHGHMFLESGDHRLLLWIGGGPGLRTLQGQAVDLPRIALAAEQGQTGAQLEIEEAARLGLPADPAMAGLARVDTRRLGRWTIIVVSSAQHQREREERGELRMIGGVGLVSLVVLGFGLVAFREQRREFALQRELGREEMRTRQEEYLAREGRAATVLTFAAGLAHEVATPLGIIGMRAEQLCAHAEEDRDRRAARAVSEQVQRISESMQRFLAIARGGAPRRERFAALEVIDDTVARVQHRFDRAGVTLRTVLHGDPPRLHGDARLLEHALSNLLLNACDASPPGAEVELIATYDAEELTISVCDRGGGMDPVQAARAVEPFVSTKPEGEGTGLGLAIASEVMRMHRGHLVFEPRVGGGTRAVLRLPAEPTPDEAAPSSPAPQSDPSGR